MGRRSLPAPAVEEKPPLVKPRAAHKAARRAKRRVAGSFCLLDVADLCSQLVLSSFDELEFVDVRCGTAANERGVRAVADLYSLREPLSLEKRCQGSQSVLRLLRSPHRTAALPEGKAELQLARLVAADGKRPAKQRAAPPAKAASALPSPPPPPVPEPPEPAGPMCAWYISR